MYNINVLYEIIVFVIFFFLLFLIYQLRVNKDVKKKWKNRCVVSLNMLFIKIKIIVVY